MTDKTSTPSNELRCPCRMILDACLHASCLWPPSRIVRTPAQLLPESGQLFVWNRLSKWGGVQDASYRWYPLPQQHGFNSSSRRLPVQVLLPHWLRGPASLSARPGLCCLRPLPCTSRHASEVDPYRRRFSSAIKKYVSRHVMAKRAAARLT